MILDAKELETGTRLEADICIVGAGPAGITLALELARSSSLKVIVLESGGHDWEEQTQSLYTGSDIGRPYVPLDEARLRFLGGSSNHWAGYCMRLTPADFEKHDWIPGSGWPITYDDIEPFYDRAIPYVEIQQDQTFDIEYWADKLDGELVNWDSNLFTNAVSASSTPTAFGYQYEEDLRAAQNVSVVLHANVLDIATNETATEVTSLSIACIDGPRFTVEAKSYVLAQGGIETARLLLLSNSVIEAGLGNQNDQVGRYFADHVAIRPSMWILPNLSEKQVSLYQDETPLDEGGFWATVVSSDTLRRNEDVCGFMFHFAEAGLSPGKRSAEKIVRSMKDGKLPSYFSSHVANLFTDLDGVTDAVYDKVTGEKTLFERDWLSPWLTIECFPNPDSRVTLSAETDLFDQRRVALDWQLTEHDLMTFRKATDLMVREVGRLGIGRVWTELLRDDFVMPSYLPKGKHAISTARMSASPKDGVVDKNCRVHDVSNLFVAGSATFTTNGYAQPTFSIVAFAIRLGDHLKEIHATQ